MKNYRCQKAYEDSRARDHRSVEEGGKGITGRRVLPPEVSSAKKARAQHFGPDASAKTATTSTGLGGGVQGHPRGACRASAAAFGGERPDAGESQRVGPSSWETT